MNDKKQPKQRSILDDSSRRLAREEQYDRKYNRKEDDKNPSLDFVLGLFGLIGLIVVLVRRGNGAQIDGLSFGLGLGLNVFLIVACSYIGGMY